MHPWNISTSEAKKIQETPGHLAGIYESSA